MFVGRWMFTHWPLTWGPCARSEMQAHLPVTSGGGGGEKWEGGGGVERTNWKVANYSHWNLTLAGWLQPRSRRFCTWNGARCYFWDVTWWKNPRGSDRRRTLIQSAPSPPPPAPTLFPLPLCFPGFSPARVTAQTQAFVTRTGDEVTAPKQWAVKPCDTQQGGFCEQLSSLLSVTAAAAQLTVTNVEKGQDKAEAHWDLKAVQESRDQTAWHSFLKQPWWDAFSWNQYRQLTYTLLFKPNTTSTPTSQDRSSDNVKAPCWLLLWPPQKLRWCAR